MTPNTARSIGLVLAFWSQVVFAEPAYLALFQYYETQYELPPLLAYAVAHQESGRFYQGKFRPYPWAININGRSHFLATREAAVSAAKKAVEQDHSFDGGLMQPSWRWQNHRFLSLADVFDPETNVRTGVQILRELYDQTGSWVEAIARYHVGKVSDSTELERAFDYADKVRRYHVRLMDNDF